MRFSKLFHLLLVFRHQHMKFLFYATLPSAFAFYFCISGPYERFYSQIRGKLLYATKKDWEKCFLVHLFNQIFTLLYSIFLLLGRFWSNIQLLIMMEEQNSKNKLKLRYKQEQKSFNLHQMDIFSQFSYLKAHNNYLDHFFPIIMKRMVMNDLLFSPPHIYPVLLIFLPLYWTN